MTKAKKKRPPKARTEKYEGKIIIVGSFKDIMKAADKDAIKRAS
jgi:hypothetical protein